MEGEERSVSHRPVRFVWPAELLLLAACCFLGWLSSAMAVAPFDPPLRDQWSRGDTRVLREWLLLGPLPGTLQADELSGQGSQPVESAAQGGEATVHRGESTAGGGKAAARRSQPNESAAQGREAAVNGGESAARGGEAAHGGEAAARGGEAAHGGEAAARGGEAAVHPAAF